jgi:pimeloyl-ACP methyl ester carboxylesterase
MTQVFLSIVVSVLALGTVGARAAEPVVWERHPIQVQISAERELTGQVAMPAKTERKLPVVLVFGGFEEAGRVLDLLQPKSPALLATLDYPFAAPRRLEFPSSLRHLPLARRMIQDMLVGIERLAEKLSQWPQADSEKITLIGASFGAPFAIRIAARRPDLISGLAVVHGFGDLTGTAIHQLMRVWPRKFGIAAYPMAWTLSHMGIAYLGAPDPERDARTLQSRQRALMITAAQDTFIPKYSSQVLWEGLSSSKAQVERLELPGDHLQPGADQLVADILGIVENWLEKTRLR